MTNRRSFYTTAILVSLQPLVSTGFITKPLRTSPYFVLEAKKEGEGLFGGYKFGDISRSIGRKVTGNEDYRFGDITKSFGKKITGDKEYEFGDISRWLDARAKSAVNEATGKDEYKFGDLTRYLDERAKSAVGNFTKKDEYVVGDISKEIVRRVSTGEYQFQDILLLCRVLASFGFATFSPVASTLPAQLLLKMFNYSIEMDIAGRFLEVLAQTLDKRFKEALTGDSEYQLGDMTKRTLMGYLGKEGKNDKYEFGDFSRAVQRKIADQQAQQGDKDQKTKLQSDADMIEPIMDAEIISDLEKFDKLVENKNKTK